MGTTEIGAIFIGGGATFFGFVLMQIWLTMKKRGKKQDLYYIKVDCMIYAFENMNHDFGTEFKMYYKDKLRHIMHEAEFLVNQSK